MFKGFSGEVGRVLEFKRNSWKDGAGFERGILARNPETQKIFRKDRDRELGVKGTSEGREGNLLDEALNFCSKSNFFCSFILLGE